MRWIEGGCVQKKERGHKWNMTRLICWCVYIYDHIRRIYTPDITVSFSTCSIILMSHLQHSAAMTFSPQDIQQQQEKVASQSQQVQQMQQDFQLLGGKC